MSTKRLVRAGLAAALAAATFATPSLAASSGVQVTDELGTRSLSEMGPLPPAAPALLATTDLTRDSNSYCGYWSLYGGGFYTSLGGSWTYLAARTGPCRAAPDNGGWGTGSRFYVSRETNGEFICKGRSYGYGSSIWYKTTKGYSWSGGTADPQWNKSC